MRVIAGSEADQTRFEDAVVTIGNFDGVHIGHVAILGTVVERAREAEKRARERLDMSKESSQRAAWDMVRARASLQRALARIKLHSRRSR